MMPYTKQRCSFLKILAMFFGQAVLWGVQLASGASLGSPLVITSFNTSSSSIVVKWEQNQSRDHNIAGYRLAYRERNSNKELHNVLCPLPNFTVKLTNLKAFTNYCIELNSFTNTSVSNRSQCRFVTTEEDSPNAPPQNFTAFNTSSTSIRVRWDPLPLENRRGIILGYKIFYEKVAHRHRMKRSVDSVDGETNTSANSLRKDLVGFEKFANYCVWAEAYNSKGSGNKTTRICISTDEDVPSQPPFNITAHNTSSTSVYVQWDAIPTKSIHGILLGYKVFLRKTGQLMLKRILSSDKLNATLTSLEKFTKYYIRLAGFTRRGVGNRSRCINVMTDEDVPTGAPILVAEKFYSKTAIKLTWQLLPASVSHGTVIGYKINVTQTRNASQPPEHPFTKSIKIKNSSQTTIILGNLSLFTAYKVQIAACTVKGCGVFGDPVVAETCRCPKYFSTSKSLSSLDKGGTNSIGDIFAEVITKSCGQCQEHNKTVLVFSNETNEESNLRFPVTVTSPRGSDFAKFIAVLEVPGVVVIKRRDKTSYRFYDEVMTGSVFDIWPVTVVSLLTIYSAGVIIWFLDRKENPDEYSTSFVKGVYEGFWWSFITMTTVGYGDRCPKSKPARAFAITWLLVSMVLLSFLMAAISSALTVTVVRSQKTAIITGGNNKAAAVSNSAEVKLAVGSLRNKFKLTTTYSSVERLTQALKDGEVDSILVDMYIPVTRKDLFNGSWFEIAALYQAEMYHGILLQGDALKLASALEELIAYDNVQTNFLKDNDDKEETEKVESNKTLYFDPNSPFFQQILYACLGALCLILVCGVVYQVVYTKQRKHQYCVHETDRDKTRKELKILVDELFHSLRRMNETLREKHRKELLKLVRLERKGRGTGKQTAVMFR